MMTGANTPGGVSLTALRPRVSVNFGRISALWFAETEPSGLGGRALDLRVPFLAEERKASLMAYQKAKHVEAAQKYLHQGKIPQAVAEYLVILKHEPKDQVTLMTVGDLFVRQGETFQALEYFERLAQIYLADGFLTKAVAIYKKITKLAPEEMRPIERLADLYVQQGVMSEARPIYLQMADMHQRANRPAQAVGLLRKLLDAEPDNARVQARLAELLLASGQKSDAVAALRTAAQQLLRRGDNAEAIQFADRALKIDPADESTLALRARALVATGKHSDAVSMLESLPCVDAGGEPSSLLVDLYLDAGETPRATALAERIFAREPKQYAMVQHVAEAMLQRNEPERALALLQLIRAAVLEGGDHEHLSDLLGRIAEALPGRVEPRELLVDLFRHTSDSFRLPDALIHLAEAYEAAGELEPALQTYTQFLEREPENEAVRRKQERLQARQGLAGTPAAPAAPPAPDFTVAPLTEPGAPPSVPPVPELNLDEETQTFVGQAITDVDLYSSYGLTQKAVDLLEVVLQRVPDHTAALERLLDLSLGLNDDTRAVELASRLEQLYSQCGDMATADRFADLRRRFERTATAPSQQAVPAPQEASPGPPVALGPSAPPVVAASPVPGALADNPAPAVPPSPMEFEIPVVDAKLQPEPSIEFAQDGLTSDASPDSVVHEVDLSEEWAALSGQQGETAVSAPVEAEAAEEEIVASALPPAISAEQAELPVPGSAEPSAEELFAEYEFALGSAGASRSTKGSPENVDNFVRSISAELGAILPPPAAVPSLPPTEASRKDAEPPAKAREDRGPLGDLFDEFRADLGETTEKEDPETHYNLGIAYREMGLMEEAISEFQKVANTHQQGYAFRYAMQCYTLLALAFMDKGQPSIAVRWYERALQVPGLDPETVLALRYDLGISQEKAGDTEAAHKSFSQVYGTNIDYRDVAERLAALGGNR